MRLPGGRDDALVEALYRNHRERVLAHAVRVTGDEHLAEDIAQEALVRAWLNLDTLLNMPGSVRAWFFTVVRRIIIDRARAGAARPVEVPQSCAPDNVADDPRELVENAVSVTRALDSLSPLHRQVLVEVYYRDRTVNEVAALLEIPLGTAKSRVFYALRQLRAVIGDD